MIKRDNCKNCESRCEHAGKKPGFYLSGREVLQGALHARQHSKSGGGLCECYKAHSHKAGQPRQPPKLFNLSFPGMAAKVRKQPGGHRRRAARVRNNGDITPSRGNSSRLIS